MERAEAGGIPQATERLGKAVLDAAFAVHTHLGPGLLETVYETCLDLELSARGVAVSRQTIVPLSYRGVDVKPGLRLDLLVGGSVIVEVKAVDSLLPIHTAQVLTYLRLSNRQLGFLINFNSIRLKDGIRRLVL